MFPTRDFPRARVWRWRWRLEGTGSTVQRVPNGGCRALGGLLTDGDVVGLGPARWVAPGGRDGRTSGPARGL